MSISIKVEAIAGSHIAATAQEMVRVAKLLGVFVEADFNGETLFAAPNSTATEVEKQYAAWLERQA